MKSLWAVARQKVGVKDFEEAEVSEMTRFIINQRNGLVIPYGLRKLQMTEEKMVWAIEFYA